MLEPALLIPALSEEVEIVNPSQGQFVLINARYKHYVKITKEMADLISLVNGQNNLNQIDQIYSEKFHIQLNVDFIHQILYSKLSKYGLLLDSHPEIKPANPSYLKLSLILFKERFLNKFTHFLFFLFNPLIAILIVLANIFLLILVFSNHINLFSDFNLHQNLLFFILLTLTSAIFHEIGHATAANFYGARHGGIGFGFYLLFPVYFADVTDIWRLTKNQRIVVNIAGIYFEMFFCSVLILLSYCFKNSALGVATTLVLIRTLVNLNPLVRSDGYWILSDLSNIPSLYTNAGNKLKELGEFLLNRKSLKWIFSDYLLLFYSLLSYAFIAYFVLYTLFTDPGSILYFFRNLYNFIRQVFSAHPSFSFNDYKELLIPILFFYLLFNFFKSLVKRYLLGKKKLLIEFKNN